jgi:hypothetical protein
MTRHGALSLAMWGLASLMVLGLIPAMISPGLVHTSSSSAPAPTSMPLPASPSITPFHPLPSEHQQLQMVHAPPPTRLGHFHLNGPTPASWGPSGIPPGAEAIQSPAQGWGGGGGSGTGGSTATNWSNRFCAGLWPQFQNVPWLSSQGAYASGCYGHDEPGIQFQSNLPGSGGNVSWNITLPTDRNATLNQSNLYSAIWFGMTLNDPYGWMDQCFLELQFYPDQTFYNPGPLYPNWTVNGAWIGAAVGWQIEASTGFEDPCFYEALYLNGVPGPAFLNMTQGDNIGVTMTGYSTSTTGEQLSIIDKTTGFGSNLTLYNSAQGYPLNPSYSQSNTEASMQWTPGGEYPVSFAFETGHAGNPSWPANNSYGGCSGGPKSTPTDPGAPCPSYDPGQWANDTLTPWKIAAPTFFNAHATAHPAQVAFTQPEGGIPLVDQTSNGVCNGIEGSAWCSYPFYSYYCSSHLFEFGAVDYTGVTADFGKWHQFDSNLQTLSSGGGFYPPTNFSIPSCSSSSASLGITSSPAGGGSVFFLSSAYASASTVTGLLRGTYSLNALHATGMYFSHWNVTGGALVGLSTSPYTTLTLTGSGTIRAVFTSHPTRTIVTFRDIGNGSVGVDRNFLWIGNDSALATVTNAHTVALAPGIYSIQAYPKPGWNFSYWSFGSGVVVAATQFPYTQLIVTGHTNASTVIAWYVKSPSNGTVVLYTVGVGTAKFGSLSVSNGNPFGYNAGVGTMRVGTYPITLTPGAGVTSWQILYGPPLIISDNAVHSFGNLENGTATLEIIFTSGAQVTFQVTPGKGGSIQAEGATGFTAVGKGATQSLALGTYAFVAIPSAGFAFSGWSTVNASTISFVTGTLLTDVNVLGNGVVTANFVKTSTTTNLTFHAKSSATSGTVTYDLGTTYANGATLTTASGEQLVTANPAAGYSFVEWKSSGKVSLVGSAYSPTTMISLAKGSGGLTAVFAQTSVPLSFVVWNPAGSVVPAGVLSVGGFNLTTGLTVWLHPGTYTATLSGAAPLSSWTSDGGLSIVSSTTTTVTLTVTTGGTIEADLS